MSFLPELDLILQQVAGGVVAGLLGQYVDVQRLSPAVSGSITTSVPVLLQFPIVFNRTTKKDLIENTVFDLICFACSVDSTQLEFGDIVTTSTAYYGGDGTSYCYVQRRPGEVYPIFIRVETLATISRPRPVGGAGAADQMPTSGAALKMGWGGGGTQSASMQLQLINGVYSYALPGTGAIPAIMPIGIQPLNRVGNSDAPQMANAIPARRFLVYVPPIPGIEIFEKDQFTVGPHDRYEAMLVYTSGNAGTVGTIIVAEKLN